MDNLTKIKKWLEREVSLRNYSKSTFRNYWQSIRDIYNKTGKEIYDINTEDLKDYLFILKQNGASSSTLNVRLNAFKFIKKEYFKDYRNVEIKFSRRRKRLPVVLDIETVRNIISSLKNIKHRVIFSLSYSGGLRVSEVVKLKVADFDFNNFQITIRNSKGRKDRITIFSPKIVPELREILKKKSPDERVFDSAAGGALSPRTLQSIFSRMKKECNLPENSSFHSLRHSFATHLLDQGTDIYYIQKLMGHKDIKTTLIYAKVTDQGFKKLKSSL